MFLLVTTGCIYFIISLRSTEGVGSREAVSVAPRSRPLCERQASSTNSCGVVRVPSKQEKDGSERKPKDSFFERDPGGERRGLKKKKKMGSNSTYDHLIKLLLIGDSGKLFRGADAHSRISIPPLGVLSSRPPALHARSAPAARHHTLTRRSRGRGNPQLVGNPLRSGMASCCENPSLALFIEKLRHNPKRRVWLSCARRSCCCSAPSTHTR